MNYETQVSWDLNLIDVWYTDIDNPLVKGLVSEGVYIVTGVPAATAGYFIPGAIIKNAVSGVIYQNTGTTATPVWSVMTAVPAGADNADIPLSTATIATAGNTDGYIIAPETGVLASVDFSGVDALAASDTNYITFSITNLGQAGAGSNPMLLATDASTTKATGGSALAANTKRSMGLNGTGSNLLVTKGDRIRVRAAATGTLANTVTFPTYMLRFTPSV